MKFLFQVSYVGIKVTTRKSYKHLHVALNFVNVTNGPVERGIRYFVWRLITNIRTNYVSKIIYSSTITNMAMMRKTAAKIHNAFTLASSAIRMIHLYDHPQVSMA